MTQKQVRTETHEALLGCEGLVEPEATNQGAWLTESAGALADLHASVLEGLSGFTKLDPSRSPSPHSDSTRLDRQNVKHEIGIRVEGAANASCSPKGERVTLEGAGSESCGLSGQQRDMFETKGGDNVGVNAHCMGRGSTGGEGSSGGGRARTIRVADDCEHADQQRRSRLHHLGRLLARRRQFTASRQVRR